MKVSICCITYNHEKFIAEALDSFLMQQVDFDYEIVIGEDGGTDSTRKICEDYQRQYPDKVKLLPFTGNKGAVKNFIKTVETCKGKYIALCEGDDYWTDPQKLEKQVSFLERNSNYSICFHKTRELYENKFKEDSYNKSDQELDYSLIDLAKGNFLHTPSVVFRNNLINLFPSWMHETPIGDYVLHILNARHGKIKYLPDAMAVYRIHDKGAWSRKSIEYKYLNFIKVLDFLIEEFNDPVKSVLKKQKASLLSELAKFCIYESKPLRANEYIETAFKLDPTLKEQWLNEEYPTLIKNILNSKRYKTGDKMASFLKKIPLVKKYVS